MKESENSASMILFDRMLERIRTGRWPVGSKIPSERALMAEFGLSRVTIRESLSMLRALGVLSVSQGKASVVQKMDARMLGRMFPLMLSLEGERSYQQIFEVRLSIESRTSYLAALNRTDQDILKLEKILEQLKSHLARNVEASLESDLRFHIQIAKAAGNPLFPLLLEALSGFVAYVQFLSCKGDPVRRQRAIHFHESITQAIKDRDPERARVEMESHLRTSADRMLKSGVLKNQPQ